MWLNDAKNLCIYKSRYVNIITCNTRDGLNDLEEIQEPKCALNHQECEEFLNEKALNIEILKVQGDVKENQLNLQYLHLNVEPFRNLNKLIFHRMIVTDNDLQSIGSNCCHLKSLDLIKCFCEHLYNLEPGVNINITNISNIVQLEELKIQPEKPPGNVRKLKLKYITQLLSSLKKLKHLNLTNFTLVCKDRFKCYASDLLLNMWPLEILNIGLISSEFWCTFTEFLKYCPELSNLTIHINEDRNVVLNLTIVDILCKYCKNVKILKLENCDLDVEDFCCLQGLQELTLNSCRGLTFNNLQQILGGLKLTTFKLINTRVFDIQNYIYISDTLESITIDTIHSTEISEMFQRSLNTFSNLQTLNWRSCDINHNWIVDKCPKLRELNITNPFRLSRIVLYMKALKELTITSWLGLSWSLLKILLFDLSLKRLNIYSTNAVIGDEENFKIRVNMQQTTLEFIIVTYDIFLAGLKYWLEILNVNEQLGLMIYGKAEDILNERLMCSLLAVDCVRQRCKRIKICGFNLGRKQEKQQQKPPR